MNCTVTQSCKFISCIKSFGVFLLNFNWMVPNFHLKDLKIRKLSWFSANLGEILKLMNWQHLFEVPVKANMIELKFTNHFNTSV